MRSIRALLTVSIVTFLLIACNGQPDPTPTSVVVATVIATPTLVPLPDSAETTDPAPNPIPTQTPADPGDDTVPTPVNLSDPAIAINTPVTGAEFVAGSELTVSGSGQGGADVRVALVQQHAQLLMEVTTPITDGTWSVTLTTPVDLAGPLLVEAAVIEAENVVVATSTVPIINAPDLSAETYILINAPANDTRFIPGTQVSIDGEAKFSGETAQVTLAILYDQCQTIASTISFDIVGSGVWEGFMALPAAVNGPFCATATIEAGQTRSAYVPLFAEP